MDLRRPFLDSLRITTPDAWSPTRRGHGRERAATRTPLLALLLLFATTACPRTPDSTASRSAPNPPSLTAAARGWNLVVVSVDTLRADRVGAWGYEVEVRGGEAPGRRSPTPRIDALAASGVRFAAAQAQRGKTWPSLASLLTGLYPTGHGVIENGYGLPDGLPTLPLLLRDAGYQTGAFLANMCKANHEGWQGWDCSGGVDGRTTRRALEWSAGLDRTSPFLLWVHYFGAHPPYYNGGDRAATELDPGYQGPLGPKMWKLDQTMLAKRPLPPRDRQHLDALYDASVMGTDGHVAALVAGLAEQGLLERTVVVFASDHGEDLAQHHDYFFHACSVYESTLHVPLILAAPGLINPAGVVEQPVELIDVLPTLLDLLGVAPPAEQHGSSLVPYLERPNRGGAGKPSFSEYDATKIRTVRSGDVKLISNPDGIVPFCFAEAPDLYPIARCELYDLARDPAETTNLCASQPGKAAELEQLLATRFGRLASRARQQEVPADLQQELEALGYVGN